MAVHDFAPNNCSSRLFNLRTGCLVALSSLRVNISSGFGRSILLRLRPNPFRFRFFYYKRSTAVAIATSARSQLAMHHCRFAVAMSPGHDDIHILRFFAR